jgi:radical SAM PhpK family P-methyltransferase
MKYDCLIIGYNDMNFSDYVKMLRSMGTGHSDYRDLNLNFIEYNGKPYRALDILTHFYFQDKKDVHKPFHNADLMWPVVPYLGTYLCRREFTFDYINLFQFEKERLKEKLEKNDYLTIAITTTIYNFDHPILEAISFIRQYNNKARLIVGGPFISKRSEWMDQQDLVSLFKYIGADFYVCSREGENALAQIIQALKNAWNFNHIDNIAYRENSQYSVTSTSFELNSLEENMIDYTLFPREVIGGFVNLRLSKGCPHRCAFCGFPTRARKYMGMSLENVKNELDTLRNFGTVTKLHFIDDTVNVPLKRFKNILRLMIKEKYDFRWNCYFRCDYMDEETVELMRNSGCEGVFLGLESANDTVLKNMNKKAGKEYYLRNIPLFKQAGIVTFVSVFVGFPGETMETFQETLDFLEETQPDFYRPQLWYCDPITPIYKEREKYGLTGSNFAWSHNTMDAGTACDLLERSLLAVDIPVWVPDPGYNYSSVYYMEHRGMSIEKQKTFLGCFQAVVREKLLYPGKKEISPHLLESLKKSCRFDEPGKPKTRPIEVLSGSNYTAAEKFWINEFRDFSPSNPGRMQWGRGVPKERDVVQDQVKKDRCLSRPRIIEGPVSDNLRLLYNDNLSGIILAAFGVLLLRLKGHEDTTIVTTVHEKQVFPVRLKPLWNLSFMDFFQATRQKLQQAAAHQLYAFRILTTPLLTTGYGLSRPVFATAYLAAEQEEANLEERLTFHPNVYREIDLVLRVIIDKYKDDVKIQFRYSTDRYKHKIIETISTYFMSILKGISENQDILLKNIVLEPGRQRDQSVIRNLASKDFNFYISSRH